MTRFDRRRFLTRLGLGTAGVALGPRAARATREPPHQAGPDPFAPLPSPQDDEAFWHLVKAQFPLRDGLVIMNAANLCPAPYPVIETVERLTRDLDGDASFHNRAKFNGLRERSRVLVADHVRATPFEIALTRNTSESNNIVVNGVDVGRGDEVVLWDQNHPTNNVAWDVKAERTGCVVKRVATPPVPRTEADLIAPFEAAFTARTRVLAFSHVSNVTGITLPAARLCRLARDRGILTLVDGAQAFGILALDLPAMGCDFYTASSHKWFLGPKETGMLYVRRERIPDLWASNVGVGWATAVENGAQKFDNLGQRDDPAVAAVATAAEFHRAIGITRVEARVRALVSALKTRIADRVPGTQFSPDVPAHLSAGVLIFTPPRGDVRETYDRLYREYAVAGAPRGVGIRLSPHVYNTMADVDRVADAVASLVG